MSLAAPAAFTLTRVAPATAVTDVGVTYRPQIFFSRAVNTATVTADTFYATGPDGTKLDMTVLPASDGSFAWLLPNTPMPGASTITLHVKGSAIRAAQDGAFLDADGDGIAGGELVYSFTTASTASIPTTTVTDASGAQTTISTRLVGKVLDPGPDLTPMTFDDIGRGDDGILHTADDVYKLPIAHARVFVVGRPDLSTFTDANGNFSFEGLPVGDVKLGIDGRTATNPPAGVFFPEMVLDLVLKAGIINTVPGSMGTREAQAANAGRPEVYLPRVQAASLQAVSDTAPTTVTMDAKSAPNLTDAQRGEMKLTVQPGTAVDAQGKVLTDVKVGISTVPPEIVKDMLPPGVLQHTFDITIQAPGVDVFTVPQQITFPNVFNADPGTKLNILSFDHTTGRLVIVGTATVSADGLTVVSDEGSGIIAPGWHGVTPPGSPANGPANPPTPPDPPCINSKNAFDIVVDLTTAAAACVAELAGVGDALKAVLTVADKVRSITESAQTLQAELDKPGVSTAQLAATFKIINDGKGAVVAVVEAFEGQASPLSKAMKIAKCLEAILGGLDNICGRIQSQGDECNTFIIKTVCIGIAVVKTELAQVNKLIGLAEAGLKEIGLALACSLIDKIATALNAAANAQQSTQSVPEFGARFFSQALADETVTTAATPKEEAKDLLGQLIEQMNLNKPGIESLQAFGQGYAQLGQATDTLDQTTAQLYSANVAGLPANAYFHVEAGGQEFRGRTDNGGRLEVFLPPNADYTLTIYDVASNRIAQVRSHTGASGTPTTIPALAFASLTLSSLPLDADGNRIVPNYLLPNGTGGLLDTDGDGLPDVAEGVVGTYVNRADSDGDTIGDLAELQQGLDPLDGQAVATGVISRVELKGTAESVAVLGSLDGLSRNIALVATGAYGLAVVDASALTAPKLLSELKLAGNSTDVAVDAGRGLAAVAAGDAGLHVVDVTVAAAPRLVQTLVFAQPVAQVEVRDGLAFVAAGSSIAVVDLNSLEVTQTLDLSAVGGGTITGLAIDGGIVYAMDSARTLRSFASSGNQLTSLGSLVLPDGGGKLFAGGGIVYVGTTQSFAQGFLTVDAANPATLALKSGVDLNSIAGQSLAANGSGLLVNTGALRGARGEFLNVIDVIDVSDPADTSKFVTRYNLPAAPRDLVIANGLAFVADGSGGLQVVNYISFDTKGKAPTVSITVDGVDVDPSKPGIQVLEGRPVQVRPVITDDVQVRNVELLVNGKVVSNDVSFPFELFAQAPTIAAGGTTLTLQVRATDTGGNATLSAAVVLDVVPDTFAPQVTKVSLDEGARVFFVRSVDVTFDEPLDTALLAVSGVSLVRAGADGTFGTADDEAVTVRLDTRSFGQSLSILPTGYLLPGNYELRIDPSVIADRAGNALAAPIVRHFSVRPASDIRAVSGIAEVAQAPSANPGQQISLPVPFDPATARATFQIIDASGNRSTRDMLVSRADPVRGLAYFTVPLDAVTGDLQVFSQVGSTKTTFADGTFLLQIVPVVTDVQVQSVSSDGSSAVVILTGVGFVEGNNSEYRFGSGAGGVVLLDAGAATGPDVGQFYDYTSNRYVTGVQMTVPLSDGAFGPITVRTAGGTSAAYSVSLSGITATALSGTPADAAQGLGQPGPGDHAGRLGADDGQRRAAALAQHQRRCADDAAEPDGGRRRRHQRHAGHPGLRQRRLHAAALRLGRPAAPADRAQARALRPAGPPGALRQRLRRGREHLPLRRLRRESTRRPTPPPTTSTSTTTASRTAAPTSTARRCRATAWAR